MLFTLLLGPPLEEPNAKASMSRVASTSMEIAEGMQSISVPSVSLLSIFLLNSQTSGQKN